MIAIIPARMDSSRFPGKAMYPIAGIPMIQRVYGQVRKSGIDTYIATSDREIYDFAIDSGYNVVMTSPDNETGTDRVAEASEILGLDEETIVVNVQGDQPLIPPECIKIVASPFEFDARLEMSTLAVEISEDFDNPNIVKVIEDEDGFAMYFSRSPIPYGANVLYKHLGIYAYTATFLRNFRAMFQGHFEVTENLEQLRAVEAGTKIKVIVTDYDSPSVDVPEDIEAIEKWLISQKK